MINAFLTFLVENTSLGQQIENSEIETFDIYRSFAPRSVAKFEFENDKRRL